MNNNKVYKIVGVIIALFGSAWGAYAGLNHLFVPREVHNIQLAGFSEQMIQMQKNSQISYWLNRRFYWQQRVEQLQYECGLEPWNNDKKQSLQEAKGKRDNADRQIRELQRVQ